MYIRSSARASFVMKSTKTYERYTNAQKRQLEEELRETRLVCIGMIEIRIKNKQKTELKVTPICDSDTAPGNK